VRSLGSREYAKALGEGEEIAAIALGESRLPEALAALKDALNLASSKTQDSILLGLALLRSEEANAFLIEVVEQASEARAAAAMVQNEATPLVTNAIFIPLASAPGAPSAEPVPGAGLLHPGRTSEASVRMLRMDLGRGVIGRNGGREEVLNARGC
jgi:hypothetical protein